MVYVIVNKDKVELERLNKIFGQYPNISKIHVFTSWDRAAIFIKKHTTDILVLDMETSGIYQSLLSGKLSDLKMFVLIIVSHFRCLKDVKEEQKEELYFLEKPIYTDKLNQLIVGFSAKLNGYEIVKS